jgi:hypothetical protein
MEAPRTYFVPLSFSNVSMSTGSAELVSVQPPDLAVLHKVDIYPVEGRLKSGLKSDIVRYRCRLSQSTACDPHNVLSDLARRQN